MNINGIFFKKNRIDLIQFTLFALFVLLAFKLAFIYSTLNIGNIALLLILSIALFTDLKSRKIYNNLIVFGLLIGALIQFHLNGFHGLPIWFFGVLTGFICCMPLYLLRGMAAGDVKLISVVGGFFGFQLTLFTVLYIFIAGGMMVFLYVLANKRTQQLVENMKFIALPMWLKSQGVNLPNSELGSKSVGKMPYTLAIFAGVIYTMFFN